MAHSALPFKPGSASARLLSWQWSFVRQATLAVCFVALYFLLTLSNVILVDRLGANVWYPALGLGFALMVGLSPAYAPLIMLVDVIASVRNYHQPMTAWATILGTPVNTAIYAVAAAILRSSAHFDSALKRRRDISIYALVTLNAAVLCSLVGAACLVGDGSVPRSEYWPTVLGWYTGDTISLLGAAPFLLVHVFPWIRWQLSRAAGLRMEQKRSEVKPARSASEFLELAGQAGSIIVVLWVIYPSPLGPLQLYYLVLLPVIWIALRQGIARVTAGILAVNLGTALCQGVYTRDFQSPLKLGVLMLVVAFTGLIVGSAVSERFHADQCLREQSAYLNLLIANSPFGIVVVDADLRISLCNAAFASLFNSQDKDLFGKGLDSLVLENEETEKLHNAAMQVFAGATVNQVVEHHRADGLVSQLELHAVPLEQAGQVRQA